MRSPTDLGVKILPRDRDILGAMSELGMSHLIPDAVLLPILVEGIRGAMYDPPITNLFLAIDFTFKVIGLQRLRCPEARQYARHLLKRQDVADVLTFARMLNGVETFSLDEFTETFKQPKDPNKHVTLLDLRDGPCRISIEWCAGNDPPHIGDRSVGFYRSQAVFRCRSGVFDWERLGVYWDCARRQFGQQAMETLVLYSLYQLAATYESVMLESPPETGGS